MAKSKEQKYMEAVNRNIENYINKSWHSNNMFSLKQILGIKKHDNQFDDKLNELIKRKSIRQQQCDKCPNIECNCRSCRGLNIQYICYIDCMFDENIKCDWPLFNYFK